MLICFISFICSLKKPSKGQLKMKCVFSIIRGIFYACLVLSKECFFAFGHSGNMRWTMVCDQITTSSFRWKKFWTLVVLRLISKYRSYVVEAYNGISVSISCIVYTWRTTWLTGTGWVFRLSLLPQLRHHSESNRSVLENFIVSLQA